MKLLTATTRTQGRRASDFSWCTEGELVTTEVIICGRDEREGPDGGCGCGRAFGGMHSGKSTTTAMVRDLDFTREDLEMAVRAYREQAGWAEVMGDEFGALVTDEVDQAIAAAELFPAGAVLEHRMGELSVREVCVP